MFTNSKNKLRPAFFYYLFLYLFFSHVQTIWEKRKQERETSNDTKQTPSFLLFDFHEVYCISKNSPG